MNPTEATEHTHMSHAPQVQPDQPRRPQPQPVDTAMLPVPLSVSGIFILTAPTFSGALTAAPELHLPMVQSFKGQ